MKHLLILSVAATLAITGCNADEKAADLVGNATEAVKDAASEAVTNAAEGAKEVASEAVSKATEGVKDTVAGAKDAVTSAVGSSGLATDEEKLGYAFGHQFAKNIVAGNLTEDISVDAMTQAIRDSLTGVESKMTDEEMQAAVQSYQTKLQAEAAAKAEAAKTEGVEFLAANKDKEGVVTTESGLQYVMLEEGKGATPTDEQSVEVNYKGTLIDGTVFDSSYDRGQSATFPLNGVIPGFTEGLKLLKEGGKIKLFIPSELAYGVQAPPAIGPNQALIFEVELIAVK